MVKAWQVVGLCMGPVAGDRKVVAPAIVGAVDEIEGREPVLALYGAVPNGAGGATPIGLAAVPFHTDDPNGTWTWDYITGDVLAVADPVTAPPPPPPGDPDPAHPPVGGDA